MSAQPEVVDSVPSAEDAGRPVAAVPEVPATLPPLAAVEVFVLRRVVGPLRRRWWKVDPNPPPPLSGPQILQRLVALPVSYWTYEFEPGVRHLGPMSQDFAAAFGLGRTNRMINVLDEAGGARTAIQALHRRVVQLEAEVARLQASAEPPQHRSD
jgi:hypothetical protein